MFCATPFQIMLLILSHPWMNGVTYGSKPTPCRSQEYKAESKLRFVTWQDLTPLSETFF